VGEHEGPLVAPDREAVDHRDEQIERDQEEEDVEPHRPVDRGPGDLAAPAGFQDGPDRHDDHPAQQQNRRELDSSEEAEKADES